MKTRTRISAILGAALLAAGTGLAFTTPANALSNNGMCETSAQTQHCWRASPTSGGTYEWARDISGDTLQHFDLFYQGTSASTNCLAGLPQSLQNALAGVGVYAMRDAHSLWIGAGYAGYLGEDASGILHGPLDLWLWTGGGQLISCYQSQYWGALDYLCHVADGRQLYVNGNCGGVTWTYIAGS